MDAEAARVATSQQAALTLPRSEPDATQRATRKRKGGDAATAGPTDTTSTAAAATLSAPSLSPSDNSTALPPLPEDPEDSPLRLLARMFFSQLKSQLGNASLAVRQEHLTLLRQLATGLPRRFPDLALLASPEVWKEVWGQ